jgi:hypothetical protein
LASPTTGFTYKALPNRALPKGFIKELNPTVLQKLDQIFLDIFRYLQENY